MLKKVTSDLHFLTFFGLKLRYFFQFDLNHDFTSIRIIDLNRDLNQPIPDLKYLTGWGWA
jgi:hypothetical protein